MAPIGKQFISFFLTIGIGMIMAASFDLYRAMRGVYPVSRKLTAVTDFFYWILLTGLVFALLIFGNWGEVRVYVFLGVIIGVCLYLKFFSRKMIGFYRKCLFFLNRMVGLFLQLLKFTARGICFPFRLALKIIAIPFCFLGFIFYKLVWFVKKLWHKLTGFIYRILRKIKGWFKKPPAAPPA